jgi:hypothetical protein
LKLAKTELWSSCNSVVKEEKINGKTKRSQICSSPVKLIFKKSYKNF